MNLLLHACCGPCAIYPIQSLLNEGIHPTLLYYNPNIQPLSEWQLRLANLQTVASHFSLSLIVDPDYRPDEYMARQNDPDRCSACYDLRLGKTAELAREQGFDAFSTTLLVSPYQDREKLLAAGRRFESEDLLFYAPDWRTGFREGQTAARELELYRQRYCGCLPSRDESKFSEAIKAEQKLRD